MANLTSQISSHTPHVTECVTNSTCSSHIMGGGGGRDIKKAGVVVEREEDSGHLFLNVMTIILKALSSSTAGRCLARFLQ